MARKCHHSYFFSGGSGKNGHCSKSHWVSIDWEHIHTYCRGSCLLSQQHQFWFEHGVINVLVWNYRNHTILIPFFCPRCTLLTTLYWMLLILNIINRVSQKKWLSYAAWLLSASSNHYFSQYSCVSNEKDNDLTRSWLMKQHFESRFFGTPCT